MNNAIERRMTRGACSHDCPDTCSFLVTLENGRAIKIQGDNGRVSLDESQSVP
jgi:hypothetical protein